MCYQKRRGLITSIIDITKLRTYRRIFPVCVEAEGPCLIYLQELEERLEKVDNYKKENTERYFKENRWNRNIRVRARKGKFG